MNDVKRYDCTNGGVAFCRGCYEMTEVPLGDYVRAEDFDALEAEAQALREEVAALRSDANSYQSGYDEGRRMGAKHRKSEVEQLARDLEALRARVVVIPDRAQHDAADSEHSDGCVRGFNDCLDELARLNGKAVSEVRILEIADKVESLETASGYACGLAQELRSLLNESAEVGDVLVRE